MIYYMAEALLLFQAGEFMDWEDMIVFKEIDFVYIVNGKRFLTEEDANNYLNKKKKKSQGDKNEK